MIKTYAEVIAEREKDMPSHYAEEEEKIWKEQKEHREKIKAQSVSLGEELATAVTLEIADKVFSKIALQAHERDITFNKMCNLIIRDGMKSAEYKFEHDNKPQFLAEDK
jgi:hypothetical protein|tara:strand:- start:2839 stop:3165 length:327 start_codon:yes stop_codon:yes gene_type:complete